MAEKRRNILNFEKISLFLQTFFRKAKYKPYNYLLKS